MKGWYTIKWLGVTAAGVMWFILAIWILNVASGRSPKNGRHSWSSPNWGILRH